MPPRLPETTKRLRGTSRKDRAPRVAPAIPPSAPVPPAPPAPPGSRWGIPPTPPEGSNLDAGAWSECASAVNERRCASHADRLAFHELVRALALLRKAAAELTASGFVYETASGARKASPAVAAWATATKTACALMDRFGLSPGTRERVASAPSAAEQGTEDAAEKFLFGNLRKTTLKEGT